MLAVFSRLLQFDFVNSFGGDFGSLAGVSTLVFFLGFDFGGAGVCANAIFG